MLNPAIMREAIRRLVPNPQTVTLRVRDQNDPGYVDYPLVHRAGRRDPGTALDQSDPSAQDVGMTRWVLLRGQLVAAGVPDNRPAPSDVIIDAAGTQYTIGGLRYVCLRQAVFCDTTSPK